MQRKANCTHVYNSLIIQELVDAGLVEIPGEISVMGCRMHLLELKERGIEPNEDEAAELGAALVIELGGKVRVR